MTAIVNVSSIVIAATGKTIKETNAEKTHQYPLNSLVKVMPYDSKLRAYLDTDKALVLRVTMLSRDCDQTPLYYLSHMTAEEYNRKCELLAQCNLKGNIFKPTLYGGLSEESLKLVALPDEVPEGV